MELQFKGGNCVVITTKKAKIVIDDNCKVLGKSSVANKMDIAVFTSDMIKKGTDTGEAFVIDGPGEYEISQVSVKGIAARAHMDEPKEHTATVYRFAIGTTMMAVVGHIYPELSDKQLEAIGMIDILILPVGGNGYTLDAQGAADIIKKIEPKIVIPTHYDLPGFNYEVPQAPLEEFIKAVGVQPEKVDKLKFKNDLFPDNMVVYEMAVS